MNARGFIVALCMLLMSCEARKAGVLDGDIQNGRLLLRQFGCGSCHDIPGVATAQGQAGPPLGNIARRVYLAGVLPNTPENMASFIRSPGRFEPRTAMPELGVTEGHARDMVAYLYTLR